MGTFRLWDWQTVLLIVQQHVHRQIEASRVSCKIFSLCTNIVDRELESIGLLNLFLLWRLG